WDRHLGAARPAWPERKAVRHRVERDWLHRVRRGVYAVGRPRLTRHGYLLAAVMACGRRAALNHMSAADLWGIRPLPRGPIEVSVPASVRARPRGVVAHRRKGL